MRYVAAAALLSAAACFGQPTITKVEPPNWWPAHSINPVRLLLHGSGLRGATVMPTGGLRASRIWVNDAGTYLLVDITVPPDAQPGSYPLSIRTPQGNATAPFELSAPLPREGRFQGFSPDDVIYLIMPDRFANGDPTNDDPDISRGLFDRNKPRSYHGGDFQGIIDHLPYLKSLGVTAIWMTPIYDNANRLNPREVYRGEAATGYHGYGAVDYYGVEEHFGSVNLLRKLVGEAHRNGIKVIQDQVANHVGPSHPWVLDSPKPTWFHGTADSHLALSFEIWTITDPHASANLRIPVLEGWFGGVLPDMNQSDPDVAQYEIQNTLWWVGTAGFDGIRQDTVPYVNRSFWRDWTAALKREYPHLRAVGEVLDPDPTITSFYQAGKRQFDGIDTGIDSVFDYPAYFRLRDVFARGEQLDLLPKAFAKDRLYSDPGSLVTFLDDHDVRRFMSEQGATLESLKTALTVLFTMRGIPLLYYGDEIAMPGADDPDNRHDFPGGWRGDPHNAFEQSGRTPEQNAIFDHVRKLTALRSQLEPLRHGDMTTLTVTKNTWVYARETGGASAIVVVNNETESERICLRFHRDGDFRGRLDTASELHIQHGEACVELGAHSAEIFAGANR